MANHSSGRGTPPALLPPPPFELSLAPGQSLDITLKADALELRRAGTAGAVASARLDAKPSGGVSGRIGIRLANGFTRTFRGRLRVERDPAADCLRVVVERPMEDYLAGVLQSELGPAAPPAALAALAVAARSFALAGRTRHQADGFDLCDTTHCFLYQGEENVSSPVRTSVRDTAGLVLARDGAPLPAPVTACCGGTLLPMSWLWGEPSPGGDDAPRSCPWCRGSPEFAWQLTLPFAEFSRRMKAVFGIGELTAVSQEGSPPRWVILRGSGPALRLGAEDFRIRYGREYGWNSLRSNLFTFSRTGGTLRVDGRGFGHCTGLCLAGAAAMARRGYDFRRILAFYFPSARVASLDSIRTSSSSW